MNMIVGYFILIFIYLKGMSLFIKNFGFNYHKFNFLKIKIVNLIRLVH
jgi:hypothetical protein